ncbi:LysM domain receptor-like kinase 4 [Glycine soja]|uniref:LysM domain receptor-like kinase 4 n=1 Tax=Glycine soja TaxID=3848 RepID=A0A445GII6_GLYSO|nr:LysM domain receptor-like kinase 4 [Glycine soja]
MPLVGLTQLNIPPGNNQYYQFNTSYEVERGDSYFVIANNTFEGLSTCQALQDQNNIPEGDLMPGNDLNVPLRCACPSKNQTEQGVKYLLSYPVASNDIVWLIGERFGVSKPSSNQTSEPSPPPPPPSSSSSSSGSSSKTWVHAVVGVVGGIALISLVLCAIIFRRLYLKVNKKKDDSVIVSDSFVAVAIEKPQEKKLEEESENLAEIISGIGQSFKVYRYKELRSATNGFSPTCCIKGSVYRGFINGDLAAIRKIDGDVSKEIELLTKVNRSNVIRLSGVCFNEGYWYLYYEYAANGNLSDWINIKGKFISWTQRIQIALDVATGLDYLHSFTSPPHVHKDLNGQVFGIYGLVSTKLDVYAFGVLMLEMLNGKDVADVYAEGNIVNLVDVLSAMLDEEGEDLRLSESIDPSLQGNYPMELAVFVSRMIRTCIKKDPANRPDMHEIVSSLSKALDSSLRWETSMERKF